jgi:hypothetical protein
MPISRCGHRGPDRQTSFEVFADDFASMVERAPASAAGG